MSEESTGSLSSVRITSANGRSLEAGAPVANLPVINADDVALVVEDISIVLKHATFHSACLWNAPIPHYTGTRCKG